MSWSAGSGKGRRTAAAVVSAPAGGLSSGDAPPISLLSCQKRNGPCTVQRERRRARSGAVALRAYGGRRTSACSDFSWPSGTLGPSVRSILPSRGGWCVLGRGARTHLTSFSFRAFRFATRCPGGRRSFVALAYAETLINNRPAAAKREAGCIPDFPGPKVSPRAARFRP